MKCVVGRWKSGLDKEDREALQAAIGKISRADLYGFICAAAESRPFSLTSFKDCLNGRCVCD